MKESIEYRSGVEWSILYADNATGEPVAGRIVDAGGRERASILPDRDAREFSLVLEGDGCGSYGAFDEALDAANRRIYEMPPQDREGYVIRELTGNEGIYSLGRDGGEEYVANAFWSSQEPGYVNCGVFAIQGDRMDILASGYCNGYLTVEDCVRDLARDLTPLKSPEIRFTAWCSREFDTAAEYREALKEGRLEEPIPVSHSSAETGKETTL